MIQLFPEQHTSPFRLFMATNKRELPKIALKAMLYNLGTVGEIGMSFFVGRIVDNLQRNSEQVGYSVLFFILSLVLHEVFYRSGHVLEIVTHAHIRERIKKALFSYTAKLSFGYFADRFAGQLAHQISTAANTMRRMEETIVNNFINNIWMLIASALTLSLFYRYFGFALIAWFLIFLIGIILFARKITVYAEQFAHEESNTTGAFVDTYTNVSAVKVYSTDFNYGKLAGQIDREYRAEVQMGKWSVIAYAYQGLAAVTLGLIVFAISVYGYRAGVITVGNIVTIAAITLKIIDSVYGTSHAISSFLQDRGECSQALKDIIVKPAIGDGEKMQTWDQVAVAYKHITFSYSNKKKVFDDFSLTIPAFQRIGIVGLSGAGKTTMVNLLLRFFDPQSGNIDINGIDITTLTQESLRAHISFISQDTTLFHASIADNIRYGMPAVSDQAVQHVAKMAYVDEFVHTLPQQYDTVVGERGVKLSGGQRQRIAIARAMLKNAPLFLLDEATSALDSDSEAKVQEALKKLMEGKTVITIAHRLSTLQYMDRIVYIDNGKIVEDGTHEDLVKQNGKYAKLWAMQAGGFLPDTETVIVK